MEKNKILLSCNDDGKVNGEEMESCGLERESWELDGAWDSWLRNFFMKEWIWREKDDCSKWARLLSLAALVINSEKLSPSFTTGIPRRGQFQTAAQECTV